MKAENFCFWLQGFFELGDGQFAGITAEKTAQIKTHLALVFKHDPAMEHAPPKPPVQWFDTQSGEPNRSVSFPADRMFC